MNLSQKAVFVVIAGALCGTCVYQWHVQSSQFEVIGKQNQTIFNDAVAIQGLTNSVKLRDDQIAQLQERVTQLKQTLVTNEAAEISRTRELARLQSSGELLSNQISQYQTAVDTLQGKLSNAYDGEKQLAAQRDEFVKKLNDSIQAQNDLTKKYNELVDRVNKLQAAQK